MGEHNNAMCNFFSRTQYYADFWNGVLFGGRQEIKPEELVERSGNYYMSVKQGDTSGKKKTSERRRDVLMKKIGAADDDILLGMEIMDSLDYTMTVRKLLYDAKEYQRQIRGVIQQNREKAKRVREKNKGKKKLLREKYWDNSGEFLYGFRREDKITPLITVALYCGTENYDGCNDLKDVLKLEKIRTEYRELVAGYPTNVIILRQLDEKNFRTGLRELIGVMKRCSDNKELLQYYEDNKGRFASLDETAVETISVMLGNKNIIECRQEEGGIDMCKAFDDVRNEGRIEGKIEGEERYAKLTRELCLRERMADIIEAAGNVEFRNRLYREFSL